jgi:hypothetical protein
MDSEEVSTFHTGRTATPSVVACLCAGLLVLSSALAVAQEPAPASGAKPHEARGFLGAVANWFDEQVTNANSALRDTRKKFERFGHEAGIAAKTTADTAKDAADAVARLPTARVITGHEKCRNAPNGAPDCVAAADVMCKAKGFGSGKSLDMTTAETCPPKVYAAGRSSGPECTTETFVSRVLCQ